MNSFKHLLILAAAVFLLPTANALATESTRPNVLWIYLEDVSGWFSCYGDELIETPNIDQLAASGIRFDRFYTPAGVCSATRSAQILGVMQTTFGVHQHRSSRNNAPSGSKHFNIGMIHLPDGVRTLPELFRSAGYYTFNEGGKDDYNFVFDRDTFYDYYTTKRGWGPQELVAGKCWENRRKDQPFFGQVQLGGGKLRKVAKLTDRSAVSVPPYYPDIELVREEIAHHYDCLLETDRQVGEVIDALKRDGLFENTVILLHSDHGYKLHRHKQFLYEGGIQMPLIVAGPGIKSGAVREDLISGIDLAPTSLALAGIQAPEWMEGVDFLADSHTPRQFVVAARDRCDNTIERIRAIVTPRYKYLKNYLTDRPYMQPSYKDPWPVSIEFRRMMAAGEMNEAQLVFFGSDKPAEELYDLENDPHEIHNLASDPEQAKVLQQHRDYLEQWVWETGGGVEPESDAGLIQVLYRWRDKCVNPEYAPLRDLIDPPQPKKKPKKKRSRTR